MFGNLKGLFGGALADLLKGLEPIIEQILVSALSKWLSQALPGSSPAELTAGITDGSMPEILASLAQEIKLAAKRHQNLMNLQVPEGSD